MGGQKWSEESMESKGRRQRKAGRKAERRSGSAVRMGTNA